MSQSPVESAIAPVTCVTFDRAAEAASWTVRYELFPLAYRLGKGHRLRVELMQDDAPFLARAPLGASTKSVRAE